MHGCFISLEGLDDGQNSLLSKKIVQRLIDGGLDAVFIPMKSASFHGGFQCQHMSMLRQVLWDYEMDDPTHEMSDLHWIYLLASWFEALDGCQIGPLLEKGKIVLIDGWIYKYLARFKVRNGSASYKRISACFQSLISPDLTVCLDTAPERLAILRFQTVQAGFAHIDEIIGRGNENFISFEESVKAELIEILMAKARHYWMSPADDSDKMDALIHEICSEVIKINDARRNNHENKYISRV